MYNTKCDNFLLIIGLFSAMVSGLLFPSIAYVVGNVSDTFGEN